MSMAVWHELWALDTGNMVSDYDTEADALADVRTHVEAYGREAVADWALARNGDDEKDFCHIAEGDTLADRALRAHAGAT
jgi:hypothetical protein